MHATFRQDGPTEPGKPIRGTFYPSDGPRGGASVASVLPKLLAIVVAMAVVRRVIGKTRHSGGSSWWARRREAVAQFHRELHADDAGTQPAAGVKA